MPAHSHLLLLYRQSKLKSCRLFSVWFPVSLLRERTHLVWGTGMSLWTSFANLSFYWLRDFQINLQLRLCSLPLHPPPSQEFHKPVKGDLRFGWKYFSIVVHYRNELRSLLITERFSPCQGSVITQQFTPKFYKCRNFSESWKIDCCYSGSGQDQIGEENVRYEKNDN